MKSFHFKYGSQKTRVIENCIRANLKEEGLLAGPKCDGLMTWRKILERRELVAGEGRLGEETKGKCLEGGQGSSRTVAP
jgi:hypothetical protein